MYWSTKTSTRFQNRNARQCPIFCPLDNMFCSSASAFWVHFNSAPNLFAHCHRNKCSMAPLPVTVLLFYDSAWKSHDSSDVARLNIGDRPQAFLHYRPNCGNPCAPGHRLFESPLSFLSSHLILLLLPVSRPSAGAPGVESRSEQQQGSKRATKTQLRY